MRIIHVWPHDWLGAEIQKLINIYWYRYGADIRKCIQLQRFNKSGFLYRV